MTCVDVGPASSAWSANQIHHFWVMWSYQGGV